MSARVVGFHGRVGPDQTPALRGPVIADPADALDWSCGTRLPGWAPEAGRGVLIVSVRETCLVQVDSSQTAVLGWGLTAHYCTSEEIQKFKRELTPFALAELDSTWAKGAHPVSIARAAFWLSRVALQREEQQRAVDDLRLIGHAGWETLRYGLA